MIATYVSTNSFKIAGNKTGEFVVDRRVKADCDADGIIIASVISSSYNGTAGETTVVIDESGLTSNLIGVLYGVVSTGATGSMPIHTHDGSEGSGGSLTISGGETGASTFLELTDTPSSFDDGKYLRATTSGTEWATVSGADDVSGGASTFLDLTDTPTTYSGGRYVVSTSSGIEFVDLEKTKIFAGTEIPTVSFPYAANIGDYYIQSVSGTLYEKLDTGIEQLFSDTFDGATIDTDKWGTRTVPNASVTVSNELQLNNTTGNAHSGAHAYTKTNFTKTDIIELFCRWKPHGDHYATAPEPRIYFRHPTNYSPESYYGMPQSNYIFIGLGTDGDSTDRTLLSVNGEDSVAISITEGTWQDLIVRLNCNTLEFSVDLNDGAYTASTILAALTFNNLGSEIAIEFGTSDYEKNNTEAFDNVE
ncbi:hypothetical protein DRQ25_09040, partial [Candidatus Fermentibacteria bacterium]